MAQGFNTRCEALKNTIVNAINHSELPIGAVYYIYKSIADEIERTYYGSLNDESTERKEVKHNDEVLEDNDGN